MRRLASPISLALNSTNVTENGSLNFIYTFSRTSDNGSPLTVNFSVGGTALNNTDYKPKGAKTYSNTNGTIVFKAGSSTAVLTSICFGAGFSQPRPTPVFVNNQT